MKANQLSDRKISATKKPGYLCDGGGLYLQVSQHGSKNWVFRFKSPELLRDREMGLGNLDTWSLAEARQRARECRQASYRGTPAQARSEFCILTAARTSETIKATWDEIDLKAGVWTVPAARMKAGRAHDVPLSNWALAILKGLPRVGDYLFPGADGAPLGHSALLELLRGMVGNGYTVHGFRSTFRDWAGDQTHFPRDVIEFALAHKVKDKTEAAYRRSSALEKRRKLMDTWAGYCERPASSGKVVSIHAKTA